MLYITATAAVVIIITCYCIYYLIEHKKLIKSYFNKKHIWLIGASQGIGEDLALQIGKFDCTLTISSRRVEILNNLKNKITQFNPNCKIFVYGIDVCDETQIKNAYDKLINEVGPVDILIYNAGVNQQGNKIYSTSQSLAMSVINTNFVGFVNSVLCALPSMKERRSGHIVGISSLAAYRGLPEAAIYGATKAAMSNFLESIRIELKSYGITSTDIKPGFVQTPALSGLTSPMPFIMSSSAAASIILLAISNKASHCGFPFILHTATRLGLLVPCFIYDFIITVTGLTA